MESLREILDRHNESGNKEAIKALDEEVGYLVEFVKRKAGRTLAENDIIQKNLQTAEANQRLIKSYLKE